MNASETLDSSVALTADCPRVRAVSLLFLLLAIVTSTPEMIERIPQHELIALVYRRARPAAIPSPFVASRDRIRSLHASAIGCRVPAARRSPTSPSKSTPKALTSPSKIETYPFALSLSDASKILGTLGPVTFGWRAIADKLLKKLLSKIGIQRKVKTKRVAMRALLLPVWKMDVALRGRVNLKDTPATLSCECSAGKRHLSRSGRRETSAELIISRRKLERTISR